MFHHHRDAPVVPLLPLGKLRFATIMDAPKIADLLNEPIAKTFRIFSASEIVNLIEESVLAIVLLDVEKNIVGFLCCKDYPPIPSVHASAWEEFIWTKYKVIEMKARNTLFIHLMCWHQPYSRNAVDTMLRSVFMHDPYVHFIGMMKSLPDYPLLVPGQARAEASFRRVAAAERDVLPERLPVLTIAERKEVCPRMRVRRAVEEDNDDIIPIVDRHSKRLREFYGDFYVSELISRHPESDRVLLVCEDKELAVGVLVLNTQINFESLEECFDISPFAGLRKDPESHRRHSRHKNAVSETWATSTFSSAFGMETIEDILASEKSTTSIEKEEEATVTGGINVMPYKTPWDLLEVAKVSAEDRTFAELALMSLALEDEDDADVEIINIDPAYLTRSSLLPFYDYLPFYSEDKLPQHAHVSICEKESKIIEEKKSRFSGVPMNISKLDHVMRYSGAPNAFVIELFAMHPDYDERYGFDMLEVAFELFPDREYCILCLPNNHTCFPLLEHFTLVAPHNTRLRFVNETLFVAHINSVRGDMSVRLAEACDLPYVQDLVEHIPQADTVPELFRQSLATSDHSAFLLLSHEQPVGLCIVGPLQQRGSIRAQYTLEPEPRKPGTDCAIICGVVSPVMEPHMRWFLREVIRQSRYTTLFYKQVNAGPEVSKTSPRINMSSLADRMQPVKQRLFVPNISGCANLDEIFKTTGPPFSLFVLERPLTSRPKVYVNSNIVVVGGSRVGLSFLQELILGPTSMYLTFTNLTLVSDNTGGMFGEVLRAATTCIPWRGRLTDKYLRTVPLSVYVDSISDVMVHIDRKNKCIYLKGGGVKFYDNLVLTCGLQFQHPDYMKESLEHNKEMREGKPCVRTLMDNPSYVPDKVPPTPELPDNVIIINSFSHANIALRKLLHMVRNNRKSLSPKNPIVVYGECIELYTCMAALLEIGVQPSCIAFVEPFPDTQPGAMRVNSFNDELIDGRVQQTLMELGFTIIHEYTLMDWEMVGNNVVSIRLMGPLRCIEMKIFALFYFGQKGININTFRAINEAGLVYDGGIIVSPVFQTNDPHVHAAGSCCAYARRLHARKELHRFYNSEEIGVALSKIILRKLNPFTMADPELSECPSELFPRFSETYLANTLKDLEDPCVLGDCTDRTWKPVMKFKMPLRLFAKLPGPLYYLKIRSPGCEVPVAVQNYLPRRGHKLVTDKNGNYFHVNLNSRHCIVGITCLSKEPFSSEIFYQLYGKHEAFFNKMLAKYQLNQITDFYEFFTQPWMSALYQETFKDLGTDKAISLAPIYEKLKNSPEFNVTCEDCKCGDLRKECGQSTQARAKAAALWHEADGDALVTEQLAKFLTANMDTNPHYAAPRDPKQSRVRLFP